MQFAEVGCVESTFQLVLWPHNRKLAMRPVPLETLAHSKERSHLAGVLEAAHQDQL
jgi:hypothetical protein